MMLLKNDDDVIEGFIRLWLVYLWISCAEGEVIVTLVTFQMSRPCRLLLSATVSQRTRLCSQHSKSTCDCCTQNACLLTLRYSEEWLQHQDVGQYHCAKNAKRSPLSFALQCYCQQSERASACVGRQVRMGGGSLVRNVRVGRASCTPGPTHSTRPLATRPSSPSCLL